MMINLESLKWKIKVIHLQMVGQRRVALASFPRSGNTWLRFMIEEATGLSSGSVYQDRIMQRKLEGIVIKTHELDADRYTHAIHIVRNPFDAISSFFYWKRDIANQEITWESHVEKSIEAWHLHTQYWLNIKKPVILVKYEDLKQDPYNQLKKITNWLNFNVSEHNLQDVIKVANLKNMRKISPNLGDKFFRQGNMNSGINQFSKDQELYLIDKLNLLLIELDYQNIIED